MRDIIRPERLPQLWFEFYMKKSLITSLHRNGIFSWIDIHFAQFIAQFCPESPLEVFLAAALASRAVQNGDICLDLNKTAQSIILEKENGQAALVCPKIDRWLEILSRCPAIGIPGEKRPLVLDSPNRLYLHRYWEYEKTLADLIQKRIQDGMNDLDIDQLNRSLNVYFAKDEGESIDWQKVAAVTAVLKKFCVITGGPGTGKTYTITKLLALLLEQGSVDALKICLAAPTGKAAARLQESIRQTIQTLNCNARLRNAMPASVQTIHRLLRSKSGSPYFHHNKENPLPSDIVVIDEASMVDLALMSKLVQAVPDTARLILIGDKDQLASVEAGSVLGDICDRNILHGFSDEFRRKILELSGEDLRTVQAGSPAKPGLQDCIVVLNKSYRFAEDSSIRTLSRHVNLGKGDGALEVLRHSRDGTVTWIDFGSNGDFLNILAQKIIHGYSQFLKSKDPLSALESFGRFKILCALRVGPFGVISINNFAEEVLRRQGLIHFDSLPATKWYKGRPILITRNNYNLGLFNGDIGITWPNPDSPVAELCVFFPAGDGRLKRCPTQSLPDHETVFALTVHKSQGSEFDEVVLILPDKDYPVLTRELLYTGITRAKKKFSIWTHPSILSNTITRKIERASGLRESLWGC
jgi:exodeoxyribonuclease V alpha subunit